MGDENKSTKELLKEMAELYEEMFAQFSAIKQVIVDRNDLSLMAEYARLVIGTDFRMEIHRQFLQFYKAIETSGPDTDMHALLSKIPLIKS
jgi:hypothetical protein